MNLLTAIPAYNEECSVESVIARSLDARENIIRNSPVTEVDVTVVSDGSTDATAELAGHYRDMINLIAFTRSQGYGESAVDAHFRKDGTKGPLRAGGVRAPHGRRIF